MTIVFPDLTLVNTCPACSLESTTHGAAGSPTFGTNCGTTPCPGSGCGRSGGGAPGATDGNGPPPAGADGTAAVGVCWTPADGDAVCKLHPLEPRAPSADCAWAADMFRDVPDLAVNFPPPRGPMA